MKNNENEINNKINLISRRSMQTLNFENHVTATFIDEDVGKKTNDQKRLKKMLSTVSSSYHRSFIKKSTLAGFESSRKNKEAGFE